MIISDLKATILLVEPPAPLQERIEEACAASSMMCVPVPLRSAAAARDYLIRPVGKLIESQDLPKLVILDLGAEAEESLALARELRQNTRTTTVPIVAFISPEKKPLVAECYKVQISSVIAWPEDPEQQLSALEVLLNYWLKINLS